MRLAHPYENRRLGRPTCQLDGITTGIRRDSVWCGVLTVAFLLTGGCVNTDVFEPKITVREPAPPEAIEAYVKAHPHLSDDETEALRKAQIAVGMPIQHVLAVAGDSLHQHSAQVWRLRRQFVRSRPGSYLAYDLRELYLYIHNDVLAAMIVRGCYNPMPIEVPPAGAGLTRPRNQ